LKLREYDEVLVEHSRGDKVEFPHFKGQRLDHFRFFGYLEKHPLRDVTFGESETHLFLAGEHIKLFVDPLKDGERLSA
jgi:hypothetical protein